MARLLTLLACLGLELVATVAVATLLLGQPVAALIIALGEQTPGELVRYAERRLKGHDAFESVAAPLLHVVRAHAERQVSEAAFPTLGKGAQPVSLAPARYSGDGQ